MPAVGARKAYSCTNFGPLVFIAKVTHCDFKSGRVFFVLFFHCLEQIKLMTKLITFNLFGLFEYYIKGIGSKYCLFSTLIKTNLICTF